MINLTASAIELRRRCLGSATVAQIDTPNPYSDAGRERHAKDEAAIGRGDIPAEIDEAWPDHDWRAEVTFAYDIATGEGRELGQGLNRDYGARLWSEVVGTADVVGTKTASGKIVSLVIVDKKSYEAVTAASKNPQVRFLALAATRAYGVESAEVGLTHEMQPLDRAVLEDFELIETQHEIRALVLDIEKAKHDARNGLPVPFNIGRQCRWCSGFAACPKQRELMAIVDAPHFQVENQIALQTNEDAAEAYELWKRLHILTKRVGEQVHARAAHNPIVLASGKIFGPVTKPGNEKLSGDVAYEVIREKHGQAIADAAIERAATKTKIRAALGFVGGKGQVAALERAVLEEIRSRGGSKREMKTEICEHDGEPRKLRAANE